MNRKCYNLFITLSYLMFAVGCILMIVCIYYKIDAIFNLSSYIIMSNIVMFIIIDKFKPKREIKNEIKKID